MTEPMSLDAAADAMRDALQKTVKYNSLPFLIQAALMLVAGIAAIAYPLLSSVALAIFLGWMLIIVGAVQAIALVGTTKVPHFWLQLISAALSVIIGIIFIRNPGGAVATLALLMIVYFMVEGMSKVVFALTVRPLENWGWVLASGLLGVAISLYLLSNPELSLVLLGILIGIQLISEGIAIGWMAWQARKS